VDELLKCGICKFCKARSLSQQVTPHLLPLAQRLLCFTRRHITSSAVLRDTAACAMLAIELVARIPPNEAVVDDLCMGVSWKALMTVYYRPLYRAVHDVSVQHGVVVAPSGVPDHSMLSFALNGLSLIQCPLLNCCAHCSIARVFWNPRSVTGCNRYLHICNNYCWHDACCLQLVLSKGAHACSCSLPAARSAMICTGRIRPSQQCMQHASSAMTVVAATETCVLKMCARGILLCTQL
jgi:hypothetical protein